MSVATMQVTYSNGETSAYATTIEVTHTLVLTQSASAQTTSPSSTSSSSASSTHSSVKPEAAVSSTAAASGSLATGGDSDGNASGGLSTKDRNIVIGVVVGVGGFLLLLGVAFACWKMWGRGSGFSVMSSIRGDSSMEKRVSVDDTSDVFRANIDQYHAPAPNTAANF